MGSLALSVLVLPSSNTDEPLIQAPTTKSPTTIEQEFYQESANTWDELGECMTESECTNAGGVKILDTKYRCENDVQSNLDSQERYVLCRTYSNIAKNLCSSWLPHWDDNDESCEKPSLESRIVGGIIAKKGEFKHIAAVGRWHQYSSVFRTPLWDCAGSLITPHFVLTAAHCALSKTSEMHVRLGEHNFRLQSHQIINRLKLYLPDYLHRSSEYNQLIQISENISLAEQNFEVKRVIKHPMFDKKRPIYHDIALLELKKPVWLNELVLPVCLPYDLEEELPINLNLTVAGWGRTGYDEHTSDILKKVIVPVVDQQRCEEFYANKTRANQKPIKITPEQICAGADGRDACKGDSGGPLFRRGVEQDGPCGAQILGIVSSGYRCGNIAIYTRVSSYMRWIMRHIAPKHYYQQITDHIQSTGLQFDGSSTIIFGLNGTIYTTGFQINIYFKTKDHNGSIIQIHGKIQEPLLTLGLVKGRVRFHDLVGSVVFETTHQYNDDLWHNLTVECSHSINLCLFKLGNEVLGKSWDLQPSMIDDKADTLVMGGDGESGRKTFYKGCLMYSPSSSLKLKMAHGGIGTTTICNSTIPGNLDTA